MVPGEIVYEKVSVTCRKQFPIDIQLHNCLDSMENQTTAGMCKCNNDALDRWDKFLNDTYKKLSTQLNAQQKKQLVEAEKAWINFKEKEIALINSIYAEADGSMWIPIRINNMMEITRQRAIAVDHLSENINEFK
ncbi:MAG TPA: lysozyme inhibitor LprI family protein [Bacteroidia bacterium]